MSARGVGRLEPFTQPIARPPKLGPEIHSWFFHPFRPDIKFGPVSFRRLLHEIDQGLEVTWNPIRERWVVWMKDPKIDHPICQGWRLICNVEHPNGDYMPLDERTLAKIFARSAKAHGNLWEYWLRVEQEMERDREKSRAAYTQDTIDRSMPSFDHSQISVSMFGPSNGSKFSTYHA